MNCRRIDKHTLSVALSVWIVIVTLIITIVVVYVLLTSMSTNNGKDAVSSSDFPIFFNAAVNQLPVQVGPNAVNNRIQISLSQERSFLNSEVALRELFINYSWFNILEAKGNNIITLLWGATYYSVIIPNGFYELPDLQQFIHEWMDPAIRQPQRQYLAPPGANAITSNMDMYLIADGTVPPLGSGPAADNAADGAHQPLIFLTEDTSAYRFTALSYGIPTGSEPTGYTFPSNYVDPGAFSGGGTYYAQLLFGPNQSPMGSAPVAPPSGAAYLGSIQIVVGMGGPGDTINYAPGILKQSTGITVLTPVATNGMFAPQIQEFSSVVVNFNLVNVPSVNLSPQAIAIFSPTVGYGFQVQVQPTFPIWIPIALTAPTATLIVELVDDNNNPLAVQDPNFSVELIVRQKPSQPLNEVDRRAYVEQQFDTGLYPTAAQAGVTDDSNGDENEPLLKKRRTLPLLTGVPGNKSGLSGQSNSLRSLLLNKKTA